MQACCRQSLAREVVTPRNNALDSPLEEPHPHAKSIDLAVSVATGLVDITSCYVYYVTNVLQTSIK